MTEEYAPPAPADPVRATPISKASVPAPARRSRAFFQSFICILSLNEICFLPLYCSTGQRLAQGRNKAGERVGKNHKHANESINRHFSFGSDRKNKGVGGKER